MLPILIGAAKVLGAGAVFSAGTDAYRKGKELLNENGPAALAGIKEIVSGHPEEQSEQEEPKEGALGGLFDGLVEFLDPLDLTGTKKRREQKQLDDQEAKLKKEAEKKRKEEAKRAEAAKKAALKAKDAQSAADRKVMEAERAKDAAIANQKLAEMERRLQDVSKQAEAEKRSAIEAVRVAGERKLALAKQELRKVKAARNAAKVAAKAPEESPIKEIVSSLLSAISSGGHLPGVEMYSAVQSQYGIPMDIPPEQEEAAFAEDWSNIL